MTINSLSSIHSTPVTGLGTQTFNIPSTGIWTVGVNFTIPWVSPDQPQAIANPTVREIQDVTCAADTSGSRNNTYFTFYDAGNIHGYYVWFNINAAGSDPAVTGLTGIEVAGATNATNSTLAGAARTAIAASAAGSYVVVSGATSHVILTNRRPGTCTAAANGAGGASAGASFSITATGSFGYASGLKIVVNNATTTTALMTLALPSPNQAFMASSVAAQFTAADVVTVVTSSLAAADALPNAVKGVINIFQGE